MSKLRPKRDCIFCRSLAEQSGLPWKVGCALGHQNEIRDIGLVYPVPVPLTICPKPITIKRLRELQEEST